VIHGPWLAHWFPGMTRESIEAGYWSLSEIVAMADFAKGD